MLNRLLICGIIFFPFQSIRLQNRREKKNNSTSNNFAKMPPVIEIDSTAIELKPGIY